MASRLVVPVSVTQGRRSEVYTVGRRGRILELFCWAWFPLLFLPNLGMAEATAFGTLQLADFLIWPLLAGAVLMRWQRARSVSVDIAGRRIGRLALLFLAWALLSSITAELRFPMEVSGVLVFSLLKLVKFALYAGTGFLLATSVRSHRSLWRMLWSMTVAAMIMGYSHIVTAGQQMWSREAASIEGYRTTNATSALMAILVLFLMTAWVEGWGSSLWRKIAPYALGFAVFGTLFSRGRGGWLAAVVGLVYLAFKKGVRFRVLVGVILTAVVAWAAYVNVPVFRNQVDKTFHPDPKYLEEYNTGLYGIDTGARLVTWSHEGAKLIDAPLLGRGFFNRFPGSGLWWIGSHNFWLQMFLETGVIGGGLCLAIVWLLWRLAWRARMLPTEVAVVVAFVAGMSGEYFYGGMELLVFVVVLASVLILPAQVWRLIGKRVNRLDRIRYSQTLYPNQGRESQYVGM